MFQFLFKYPIPVFTKGRFVLLSAWPAWLLPVFIVAAVGRPGAADPLATARRPRPSCAGWRAWVIWGMQSAHAGAAAAAAVAAGDDRGRTEFAAEHHRRGGGRLAQHGHCGRQRPHARSSGPERARRRRAGRPAKALSDARSIALDRDLTPRGRHAGHRARGRGHAYRRWPEAACSRTPPICRWARSCC